jgi:hypothetical protein
MFAFITILFAFKTLISYSSLDYIMNTLIIFTKTLMLPMLYLFFILKLKKNTLLFLAKHFSILIILSFIPYMLGILEPLGTGYDLGAYGLDGQFGLVGPFIKPHSASISLAFALIIITRAITNNNTKLENIFLIFLIILAFIEMALTYVRTGLTIYIIAILYLFMRHFNFRKLIMLIVTFSILFLGGLYLYKTNDVVKMRLNDNNKYVKNGDLGSGRLQFWKAAVENWLDDDTSVIFIGLGEEYAKDKMFEDVGLRIFAHNNFFQILQQEGLIGMALFLASLFLIYGFIKRNKGSIYYPTAQALFLAMLAMMMFQGGFYFNIIFFLSIYLALLKLEYLEKINPKKVKS